MNLYRKIDRSKFRFVFLVDRHQDEENFADEIHDLGGEVYYFDSNQPLYKRIKQKYKILKNIDYSIAHIHVSCGIRAIDGILSKLAHRNAKLLFHSHSNIGKRPLKYSLLIPIYRTISDKLFACSDVAAQYFFGKNVIQSKKYKLLKNAVDPEKFLYSVSEREQIRACRSINEKDFLLGYVGRLSPEKNVGYLIDVVFELNKLNFHTKALIVGDGDEKQSLEHQVEMLGMANNIVFVGTRENVGDFLSAFDALMLPSHNEGLGIVLIEAQAASLICFASDVVPKETNISPLIKYIDIKKHPRETANFIYKFMNEFNYKRPCYQDCLDISGYNINTSVKELENIYL